jgi:hypothetical protein
MGYDKFYLGWNYETIHGTTVINDAADTAYTLGSIASNCFLPAGPWDTTRLPPDWGERKTSGIIKTGLTPRTEACAFLPRNAIPFYWLMGDSSTAGTVHTIDAASQASGVIPELPSLCFHAERVDTAAVLTDWRTGWRGMRTTGARIFCGDDDPELTCVFGFMGMTIAKDTFSLTTKPANPSGTHTSPRHYLWAGSTHKYDGTTIAGVTGWEITVNNNTFASPPDYGEVTPSAVHQGGHQTVDLSLTYIPVVETLQDDYEATTVPAKDWEFEFVRHATNDKLKFPLTTAGTVDHGVPVPNSAGEFEVTATAVIESMTVTATDQIAGSFYGD